MGLSPAEIYSNIHKLHWRHFEYFCGEIFARRGWFFQDTPATNDDSLDAIVVHPLTGLSIGIQSKQYRTGVMSVTEMEKYVERSQRDEIDGLIVMLTSKLSPKARQLCNRCPTTTFFTYKDICPIITQYHEHALLSVYVHDTLEGATPQLNETEDDILSRLNQQGIRIAKSAREYVLSHRNIYPLLYYIETSFNRGDIVKNLK